MFTWIRLGNFFLLSFILFFLFLFSLCHSLSLSSFLYIHSFLSLRVCGIAHISVCVCVCMFGMAHISKLLHDFCFPHPPPPACSSLSIHHFVLFTLVCYFLSLFLHSSTFVVVHLSHSPTLNFYFVFFPSLRLQKLSPALFPSIP